MNFTRWVPAALAALAVSATVVAGQRETAAPAPKPAPAAAAARTPAPTFDVTSHEALVQKSCISCHNDKTKTGGLSLQGLSLADIPAHGPIWEKVLLKVRSGEMPP